MIMRTVASLVIMAATGLGAAGCAGGRAPIREPQLPPLRTPLPTTIPAGEGAVVGGIDICGGVIPKVHVRFVAGRVEVFAGPLPVTPDSPPGSVPYPSSSSPLTTVTVGVNQEFRLVLPPGQYVLVVGAPWVPVPVLVRAGTTVRKDIPGECL